jgi:hypothetical protein
MVALICALEDWLNDEPHSSSEAAECVVEALDNFEYVSHRRVSPSTPVPDEYPLLDRELQWQADIIKELAAQPGPSIPVASELLQRNLHFQVPLAV